MAAKLSEHKAWLYMAKLYKEASEKSKDYVIVGKPYSWQANGMCRCISLLQEFEFISTATGCKMSNRMVKYIPKDVVTENLNWYWWPTDSQGQANRAKFCRKMARMTNPKPKVGVKK